MATKPEQGTPQPIQEAAAAYQLPPMVSLVDKAIADAEALQKTGKTTLAIEKWRAIANIVEGTDDALAAHAWFQTGMLLAAQALDRSPAPATRYSHEALAAYDNAIRLDATQAEIYLHRAKAKLALGHYDAALANVEKQLCLEPASASAYTVRGVVKFCLSQHEAAFADFEAALRLDPGCADAYAARGIVKSRRGEYEAALADFDAAIHLLPEVPTDARVAHKHYAAKGLAADLRCRLAHVYHNRAYAKAFLGQRQSALADYDTAIRLSPECAASYTNRGQLKDSLGQREAAQADFEAAIHADSEFAQPYIERALEKIRQNRDAEARADFEIALKLACAADDKTHQDYVESWLEDLGESQETHT